MDKLIDIKKISSLVSKLKKKGKKIVTTNGSFDLFHVGHLKSLEFAKKQGDILIVGLNSDISIKDYKKDKKRPINNETDRAKILDAIRYVDYIIIFNEPTPENMLSIIKPNIHVKGNEYKKNLVERRVVEENGGKIVFVERNDDNSTTSLINKILQIYDK